MRRITWREMKKISRLLSTVVSARSKQTAALIIAARCSSFYSIKRECRRTTSWLSRRLVPAIYFQPLVKKATHFTSSTHTYAHTHIYNFLQLRKLFFIYLYLLYILYIYICLPYILVNYRFSAIFLDLNSFTQ